MQTRQDRRSVPDQFPHLANNDQMADGAPLRLDHAPRISSLLDGMPTLRSEYCFANLFLFRHQHAYRFFEEPVPHLRGTTYDLQSHIMPLTPVDATVLGLLDDRICLYPLGPEAPALARRHGLECVSMSEDSDYVYEASRLSCLKGAKAKRAQARRFEDDHAPTMTAIDASNIDLVWQVLEGWLHDIGRAPLETDLQACREALRLRKTLGLEGMLVSTRQGEPASFLLSSRRGEQMRVVHFAKGRRQYAGAYPWMFAHYAAACSARLLNFEQDLGKPRFAQAKRALAPRTLLKKYRLTTR